MTNSGKDRPQTSCLPTCKRRITQGIRVALNRQIEKALSMLMRISPALHPLDGSRDRPLLTVSLSHIMRCDHHGRHTYSGLEEPLSAYLAQKLKADGLWYLITQHTQNDRCQSRQTKLLLTQGLCILGLLSPQLGLDSIQLLPRAQNAASYFPNEHWLGILRHAKKLALLSMPCPTLTLDLIRMKSTPLMGSAGHEGGQIQSAIARARPKRR